jgi:2-phospho-L-lactate guanylyltransferase
VRWTVLIPAKSLPEAKSRLMPSSTDLAAHHRLVRAIRTDTRSAVAEAVSVARVLHVTDRASEGDESELTFIQKGDGLNAALSEAAAFAAARWPDDGIAALVGDLPALQAGELDSALDEAARWTRCYVPDAAGTGTTMLTALPGEALQPSFGPDSAARHGAIATAIEAGLGLRQDVDTDDDLRAAADLGLGYATRAVLWDQHGTEPPAPPPASDQRGWPAVADHPRRRG